MGLYDRSYMYGQTRRSPEGGMSMLWQLIGVNIAAFLLAKVAPELAGILCMTAEGIRHGLVFQVVTAAFLHFDFFHILLNMYGLYLFGSLVAPYLSRRQVLALYLIGGVTGNLLFLLFNWNSSFALLGASGAVFGFTIAAAMLEPNRRFALIFLPMAPIKTSTLVIVYTIIELVSNLAGADNVAHLAHLGGFLGGYLYLKSLRHLPVAWDPLRMLSLRFASDREGREGFDRHPGRDPEANPYRPPADPEAPVPQREVDRLLDKLSQYGIRSLTPEEEATLRRVREQMNRRN